MYRKTLGLFALVIALSGCSRFVSSEVVTDREVLNAYTETVRTKGELEVKNVTWKAYVFEAEVIEHVMCTDIAKEDVRLTKNQVNTTENVWVDVGGGLALSGVAAGLFVVSQSKDDTPDPLDPDANTEKQNWQTGAILTGSAGVLLLGYGLMTAVKGVDQTLGTSETTEVISRSERKRCGDVPGTHELLVRHGESAIKIPTKAGRATYDFKKNLALCDPNFIGSPARVIGPDGKTHHELNIDDCAKARRAQIALDEVNKQLEAVEPDFAKSSALVTRSEGDLSWQEPNPAVVGLLSEIGVARVSMDKRANEVAGTMVVEFKKELDAHGFSHEAHRLALNSIGAAAFANLDPEATFRKTYGALLRDPELDWSMFETLVTEDQYISGCVVQQHCPGWWKDDTWKRTAHKAFTVRADRHDQQAADLESKTKKLKRRITLENAQAVQMAIQAGADYQATWCTSPVPTFELNDACVRFNNANIVGREELLSAADKLHQQQVRFTAKEWRKQFKTCRKVASGIESFKGISSRDCGASCRAALDKLRADFQRLNNFSVPDAAWDEPTLRKVRSECEKANCPTCP